MIADLLRRAVSSLSVLCRVTRSADRVSITLSPLPQCCELVISHLHESLCTWGPSSVGFSLPVSTCKVFLVLLIFRWLSIPDPSLITNHTPNLSNVYVLNVSILGKLTSASGHCFSFHTCVFNISQHLFTMFKAKLEISTKNLLLPQSFPSWSMVTSFFQVFRAARAHLNPSHSSTVNAVIHAFCQLHFHPEPIWPMQPPYKQGSHLPSNSGLLSPLFSSSSLFSLQQPELSSENKTDHLILSKTSSGLLQRIKPKVLIAPYELLVIWSLVPELTQFSLFSLCLCSLATRTSFLFLQTSKTGLYLLHTSLSVDTLSQHQLTYYDATQLSLQKRGWVWIPFHK